MSGLLQVRVTGVVVENDHILLVKQQVAGGRGWSLPGGRVEPGETLEEAVIREMEEETGIAVNVGKLLYVCDKPDAVPPLVHITFLLEKVGGELRLPSNEFDRNPIRAVAMVPVDQLEAHGFSATFRRLVQEGFPQAGSYQGLKHNIGL
ncbi:NADH pyrophosphatase [Paenibacillus solanacearum]|uniref:NADH pyrophosphatase n=1 Tax=Paenibacillus solanacearum TaxID=2048548 RepID=A0A916NYN9_9BACL|nr:NUDIX hydrolase [Paenibacillus solanacearum]CAG7647868.1 NADH pyrophosphatase [Paenibacillus solanacearum]